MSRFRRFALPLAVLLVAATASARAQPPPAPRTDRYGDPLPAGVIARLGTVRLRHSGEVNSVALSPDGKLIASAATWNTSMWDLATGRELDRFKGKIRAEVVAFSPDGKTLLATGRGGGIQHWDVATGALLRQTKALGDPGDKDWFHALVAVFSPDRKLLAFTDHGHNALLCEVATGKRLLRLAKQNGLLSIAVSHDGKTLVTGGQDKITRLWDVATGKVLCELPGLGDYGSLVQFSPDDKLVVSSASRGLRVWDVATGKRIWETPEGGGRLAFSPDGKILASAAGDTIHFWDAAAGKELRQLKGHGSWLIPGLAFSADGKILVSGSRDHTVGVWDVATGKPLHRFEGHQAAVVCLTFAPDGRSLASGGDEDHTLIVWDLATHKPRHFLSGHGEWVLCVQYSPDGRLLASGDGSNGTSDREAQIRLWNAADGRLLRQFFGHLNSVQSLAFSPDGKTLASAGWDARTRLWDAATGKRLHQIRGADCPKSLAFSADGRALLIAEMQGELVLWSAATGQKLRPLVPVGDERSSGTLYLAPLPDGKTVVTVELTATADERLRRFGHREVPVVRFWDTETTRQLRSFILADKADSRPRGSGPYALSPDGKTLVATCGGDVHEEDTIRLWDTTTGKPLVELRGHTGMIYALAFSPDGRVLASGSWDTTVLLWNLAHARLVGLWRWLHGEPGEAAQAAKQWAANPEGAVPFLKERLREAAALEAPFGRLIADLDSDQFTVRQEAFRQLEAAPQKAEFALRLALEGKPSTEVQSRVQQILAKLTAEHEEQVLRLLAKLDRARHEDQDEVMRKLQALGFSVVPILQRFVKDPPAPRRAGDRELSPIVQWHARRLLDGLDVPDYVAVTVTPASVPRGLAALEQIGTPEARQALQELAKGPTEAQVTRAAREALARGRK